ncbi:hypothetical protein [Thiorhodovibrio frisius]|uniref:hypothetical protein n=1 Tax=Thiorhodovibrio frisius TaxID=631362 RepID=UPI000255DDE1|nr:hypothetical protein [Thiorhodovibrio frisius]
MAQAQSEILPHRPKLVAQTPLLVPALLVLALLELALLAQALACTQLPEVQLAARVLVLAYSRTDWAGAQKAWRGRVPAHLLDEVSLGSLLATPAQQRRVLARWWMRVSRHWWMRVSRHWWLRVLARW